MEGGASEALSWWPSLARVRVRTAACFMRRRRVGRDLEESQSAGGVISGACLATRVVGLLEILDVACIAECLSEGSGFGSSLRTADWHVHVSAINDSLHWSARTGEPNSIQTVSEMRASLSGIVSPE